MNDFLNKCYKPVVMYIYILLLPITEIITTYMLRVMKAPVTLGMIYKPLFLLYAGIYLVFVDKKNKVNNYIYLAIMTVYIAIYMCVTLEMNFSMINREILGYVMTYMYLPIILMFLYRYYKNGNRLGQKILIYTGSIYAFTMLMAYLSNTQIKIYGNLGQSGWFNAANELGAIFAIIYPILLFYTFENKKIINFLLLGLCTWAIISIGSRVSFLVLGITIIAFLIYYLIKAIKTIKDRNSSFEAKKGSWVIVITSIILVAGLIVCYPYSPFARIWENRKKAVAVETVSTFEGVENEIGEKGNFDTKLQELIFNGRQLYLYKKNEIYGQSNFLEKMFGLTYKSQYIESNKRLVIVERDFHDIFFQYGIFGLILFFYPMFLIIREFIRENYKNKNMVFDSDIFAKCLGIVIVIAVAYVAGHVLLFPGVSIFLAIAFVSIMDYKKASMDNKIIK